MGTRKIAPAIAAGCTMVVKPAQQTPLSMLALAKILEQAGLPRGVLNVVTAKHSGALIEPLLRDPRTRKLSFTGSTEVGRTLIEQSAEQVLRVSMELGGNAPFLVFEDADLDAAVEGAMLAKMRNVGEACTAANRFHVHESVAEEFARRMAERMGAMKVGRGTEPDVDVGPLIDGAQLDEGGRARRGRGQRGAQVELGRRTIQGAGYFYEPTVLTEVPADARVLAEEVFGPVPRSPRSPRRSRRSRPPTAPSSAWSPTCTRATSTVPSACARGSRREWWGSTRGLSPIQLLPSAASSSRASAARAASRESASTWRPSTWRWGSEGLGGRSLSS